MARKESIRIVVEVDVTYNDNPNCNLTDGHYDMFRNELTQKIKSVACDVINSRKIHIHDVWNERMIVGSSLAIMPNVIVHED